MTSFTSWLRALSCLLALFLALTSLSACKTPKEQARNNLGISVQTYHQHMRWRRWQEASKYLAREDRNEFLGRMDELGDDYKIVSVEIRHIDYKADQPEATSEVVVEWLQEPEMVVHKEKITETWTLHDKVWLLTERDVKEMKNRVTPR